MAASSAGAVKTKLETLSLGVAVFRDRVPESQTLPYITITEQVSLTLDRDGDFGDSNAVHSCIESVQVDVWQQWRSQTAVTEDYDLAGRVARGLHGARLDAHPKHVYATRVASSVRLLEPQQNVVHHALSVDVYREL